MIVKRKKLSLWERLYLPAVIGGFKVTLRHFFRKKVTMQYPEERWVVPALAPDYLAQDFTRTTPSEYLVRVAPLARVEYRIEARPASPALREALELEPDEPCLLLHRRTFSGGRAASIAELWHPGHRYRLAGHF